MVKNNKLGIGMPAYNSAKYIRETIESILNQTYQDFELHISDNASTDDTEVICREYQKLDSRVKYHRNKINIGANYNFNEAFCYTNSLYFKWVSSSDIHAPESLQRCVEVLEKQQDVVLCYPKTKFFADNLDSSVDYEDGLNLQEEEIFLRFKKYIEKIEYNHVLYGVIRSEVLKKTKLMKNFNRGDISLLAEIALHGKFFEVPIHLYFRRMEPKTTTKFYSKEELARHFDPNLDKLCYQNFKWYMSLYSGVGRTKMSKDEKIKIYFEIMKYIRWDRLALIKELYEDTCYKLRKRLFK